MTRVCLLGSTGSIGCQAIEVIEQNPHLELCALAAASSVDEVIAVAERLGVPQIALADAEVARAARERFAGTVVDSAEQLAASSGADICLNAVVGVAGLDATLAALEAGIDVALANKESLVAGGPLVRAAMAKSGAQLLPVDSEHSALAQLVTGEQPTALVLTASGGPFRGRSADELEDVTIEDALQHPTWSMGAKITVDSATLMNKGLEVIEAHWLFDVPYDAIEVVVHPQSIIHALVRLRDGSLLAHLGLPDMRVPISWALSYPRRDAYPAAELDLAAALTLTFEKPDLKTFRCLALARQAGLAGGLAPCVLNAANEQAVAAFLAGRCRFLEIASLVESALEHTPGGPLTTREQISEADAQARRFVRDALGVPA